MIPPVILKKHAFLSKIFVLEKRLIFFNLMTFLWLWYGVAIFGQGKTHNY